ncbi:small VCP/p97-interacting protein isoform X1 [Anguilla rostrata]|uniref:small VCP/p97-interacting protein isoform X1 n=1 Tax=Anguilla rostrata TaxID=7938 RepID=UPI0030CC4E38
MEVTSQGILGLRHPGLIRNIIQDTKRRQLAEAAEKRQKERLPRRFPVTMLSHHRSHQAPRQSRQPTEESKNQRQWRGRRKNRRRWKSRP